MTKTNKPLNIWMINHYAGNLELGMEYRHFFLSRHLQKAGHRPHILSASFHHLYRRPPEVTEEITFKKYDEIPYAIIKTPHYSNNGIKRFINSYTYTRIINKKFKKIENHFQKPDIIIGSSPHPFIVWNLTHLKKVYNIPVIFEVRDLWPLILIESYALSRFHPLCMIFSYLERLGFKHCDITVSLWHSASQYMTKKGLKPEKYRYIPNGIELSDRENFSHNDCNHTLIKTIRKKQREGKFIIGYGGSLGVFNPTDCIVDTCDLLQKRKIHDVEFFIVGDGAKKEQMIQQSKKLNLKNITFHNYVDKNTITVFFRLIDVAFMGLRNLPLFKYGPTPNKLMDYMANKKPIIYAINSRFNPIKDSGAGISVEPDNPAQLADAIVKLKTLSKEQLIAMGKSGRNYAEENLSFKALSKKYIKIMEDLKNN